MTGANSKLQDEKMHSDVESSLKVRDLIRYFAALASLNVDKSTGNRDLSQALQALSKALKPYADRSVSDLVATLGIDTLPPSRKVSKKSARAIVVPDLETASYEEIERIISDGRITKTQLIEIGFERCGISKSRLLRINRADAIGAIRSALDHERSLGAITQEARRGGIKRSS